MFYSTSKLNDLTLYYTTVSWFPSAAVTVMLLYPIRNMRGSLNYHSNDD